MTTIEERANAYAIETIEANKNPKYDRPFAEFIAQTEKNAYIKGATEQREIDIQRAVEWFGDFMQGHQYTFDLHQSTINVYVNLLEKAMKGDAQ